MVFDCAESNGDDGEPVQHRDGASGVLGNVVGGLEAPPGLIKACRYCLNRYLSTSYSLVTIPNAYNNALLLKAYFKVSSRGSRLLMTRFLCVDTRLSVIS